MMILHLKNLSLATILDTSRFLPQRRGQSATAWEKHSVREKEKKGPSSHMYLMQPRFNRRIRSEKEEKTHERFRLCWRKPLVDNAPSEQNGLSPRLRFNNIRELTSQSPAKAQSHSRTYIWLSHFAFNGTVIPKHFSQPQFPAGVASGHFTPPSPRKRRTEEDKRRVEAMLRTPIAPLAEYITPEMMDMLKKSPFNQHGEDVLVFRSHWHRTRGQNLVQCFNHLSRLVRNVASEIVYREQRVAADEKMYRKEGTYDDPE